MSSREGFHHVIDLVARGRDGNLRPTHFDRISHSNRERVPEDDLQPLFSCLEVKDIPGIVSRLGYVQRGSVHGSLTFPLLERLGEDSCAALAASVAPAWQE